MPETSAYFHIAYTVALGIYAGIVLLLLLRLVISYGRVCLLRRRTRPAPADVAARLRHWLVRCPTERNVELRVCDKVRSPLAIGFRTVVDGYTALAEYPDHDPTPDAAAVVALQWPTLPPDAVDLIRHAIG